MSDTVLSITAGIPFTKVIRIPDAKNVWASLDDLEVRAQLRTGKNTHDDLISNLHDFMTPSFDVNDLVITWVMTGAQTRELYALRWGLFKKGYFNIIVSDAGTVDSRALVVPLITLEAKDTTTKAGGLT